MMEVEDFIVPHTHQSSVNLVSFIPGPPVSKVRRVGGSDSVNELTNILQDCQINQVKEVLAIPHPELVGFFHQILDFVAVKPNKLTLDFSVHPNPCVTITGAPWEVEKFKNALDSTNLILQRLVFDGPGAQRYFQADGKVSKELIESSSKVIVKVLQGLGPPKGSRDQSSITPKTSIPPGSLKRRKEAAGTDVLVNNQKNNMDVNWNLKLNRNQGDRAFSRDVIVANGVKLQLVFGDITTETTDAVVNSTNFKNLDVGVCKAILSVAGSQVEAQLKTAKVTKGSIFVTPPGMFPCKAIIHVHAKQNTGAIEQLVRDIIQHCETSGYESVAIPAICAGAAGMDPDVIAYSILQAIKTLTSSTFSRLCNIRLVLKERKVFLAFKDQLKQMFPHAVNDTELASQQLSGPQQYPHVTTCTSILCSSSASQQSVFMVLGLCQEDVNVATRKLTDLYQAHSTTKTFTWDELMSLNQDDVQDLKQLLEREGLSVQEDQTGKGDLMFSGLKDGVNQVVQMIQTIAPLRMEMKSREDENVDVHVTWCIQGQNGEWERLPKKVIRNLESARVVKDIVDGQGLWWSVDLQMMEAKSHATGHTRKLKRLQDRTDFKLPLYWDDMATDENLKVVTLETSSEEFGRVCDALRKTVRNTVLKIERLQNVHLRRAYEVQKEYISEKNKHRGGAGELQLYHGTSQDNCESILKNGFNRSFCGKNATSWGQGTYFAVNACYSALSTYASPGPDGSCSMFLARVLTGSYTQGSYHMKVAPLRNSQQSHEHYDSVVDNTSNPQMYVVFTDNQAYPDYRITFR